MPMELQIIRAAEFVRLGARGHFDFEASKAALAKLAGRAISWLSASEEPKMEPGSPVPVIHKVSIRISRPKEFPGRKPKRVEIMVEDRANLRTP